MTSNGSVGFRRRRRISGLPEPLLFSPEQCCVKLVWGVSVETDLHTWNCNQPRIQLPNTKDRCLPNSTQAVLSSFASPLSRR
jgi:hypothetical protein